MPAKEIESILISKYSEVVKEDRMKQKQILKMKLYQNSIDQSASGRNLSPISTVDRRALMHSQQPARTKRIKSRKNSTRNAATRQLARPNLYVRIYFAADRKLLREGQVKPGELMTKES